MTAADTLHNIMSINRIVPNIVVNDLPSAMVERAGQEVVYPLTDEPWGVTRFFYRASDGNVVNVGTDS